MVIIATTMVMTMTNRVGRKLQELREALGITQEELSKRSGIPKGTIAPWEASDIPSLKTTVLPQLAKGLEVPLAVLSDYLIGDGPMPVRGMQPESRTLVGVPLSRYRPVPLVGGTVHAGLRDWQMSGDTVMVEADIVQGRELVAVTFVRDLDADGFAGILQKRSHLFGVEDYGIGDRVKGAVRHEDSITLPCPAIVSEERTRVLY